MHAADLDGLPVAEIMSRWPATIGVFLRFHLHCVGCPVSAFNTLEDAAAEHACSFPDLRSAVLAAIADADERASAADGPGET